MNQLGPKKTAHRRLSLMIRLACVGSLIATMRIGGCAFAKLGAGTLARPTTTQESKQTDVRELKLDEPIERELKGGEGHSYRVMLTVGQYLHVVVEQKGIDVVVRLFGPDGQKITEVDGPWGTQGMEPVYAIAEATGVFRLEVKAVDERAGPGRYEIDLKELRQSTIHDRDRLSAGRAFAEAEPLRAEGSLESLRKAIEKYNEALSLWRSGEDHQEEARTLNRLGSIHWTLGQYQKALEYYDQGLRLWRAVGDQREEARTVHNIGTVYWQMGDSRKALDYYGLALPLWRAVRDRTGEANTLGAMGLAYDSLGRLEEAIDFHNQSLALQHATGDLRNEANTLNNIATAYSAMGDFQKALELLNRALPLRRAAADRRGEGLALSNIGVIYWQIGENEKALTYYHQALSLRRETGDRAGEFSTLHNIGRALGNSLEAFEYYSQALSLARALGDRRGEGAVLQSMGAAYSSLGESQKAISSLKQALLLHRDVGDRRQEAIALSLIGASYSMDKPDEAQNYLEQALSLHRVVGDRTSEAATLQRKAQLELKRGRLSEARTDIEEALKIIESTRSQLVSQQLRTSLSASRQDYYEFYIDLLMRQEREHQSSGYDAAALEASERARARTLLDILTEARAHIRQGADPILLDRERTTQQQLSVKSERLTRLLASKHSEEQETAARKEVDAILSDYQDVEAQIRARSPRYAALTQPQPLTSKEIRQLLDDETLLLEYALGEERSYLWAVTPTSIKSYELPRRAEIEADARRVYDLLVKKADTLHPEALTSLSRTLLGPVADQLGRKRLLIVGQGALQYVPFGVLLESSAKERGSRDHGPGLSKHLSVQPLIVNHEIVSLPSASVIALLRRELSMRRVAPNKVVVLADPVFGKDDQRVKQKIQNPAAQGRDGGEKETAQSSLPSDVERSANDLNLINFDRLPVSRSEAELITGMVPKAQSRKALDFAASRATATSPELGNYQIVHFATHSLLNNQHPELSGIVLSLVDEQGQPQDGFLRLHEIYNLKLGADLVVLSSCQTALGKEIKGEGLVGLTRGFMYAGTPRVVASLWKVSDKATAELMKRFYQKMLREGLRPAAALRAAQVSMLNERQWAAPYYWAGFVLQGEWR